MRQDRYFNWDLFSKRGDDTAALDWEGLNVMVAVSTCLVILNLKNGHVSSYLLLNYYLMFMQHTGL